MIAEKIRDEKYSTWSAYETDIKLLCKNAKCFNEPGSVIYKDACKLLIHFNTKKDEYSSSTKKLTHKEYVFCFKLFTTFYNFNVVICFLF